MKIISIGPASPLRGGIAKFNESFVLACNSQGHNTEIFSFSFLYPRFLFPGKTQYSEDPAPETLIIHSVIHPLNPFNWCRVAKMISRQSPDIVVIHYWMPFFAPVLGTIARKVRKNTGAVIIAIAHNLIPHEKQPGSEKLTRYFLKSLHGLVVLSSSVVSDFFSFKVPGRVVCLPHPIYDIYGKKPSREESVEYLKLDPEMKYLLFFGLIRKYKGLELLLDAFSRIKDEKIRLIVAGEFYEDKNQYINLAATLGIADRIIFTDKFIPDGEVRYYFSVAETVVQPYLSATQSGVTQIAYHFECPMVVTDVGGLPEIVLDGKTGFVCNIYAGEIASAIQKSLDPNIRDGLIKGIRNEKHRFSWHTFVEKLVKMAKETSFDSLTTNH